MKTVYTCFTTDVIHEGHLNIIKTPQKYGRVVIGCLSDKALEIKKGGKNFDADRVV